MFRNSKSKKFNFRLEQLEKQINELKNTLVIIELRVKQIEAENRQLKEEFNDFCDKIAKYVTKQ
ncbi:hypothetical protein J7L36_00880 [bacterium]|nr:hypothetical protein [bacterium]